MTVPLAVVVMTFDEEVNLGRCLESISGWAEDIFVVDSFSSDRTLEIAAGFGAKVYQHGYEGHPQQWSWALETLPFRHDWVFALDADFVVTTELKAAISGALAGSTVPEGFLVRHRQVFRGRFIRHGTIYPRYWLRLFRRDKVFLDRQDLVDLHFYVRGLVGVLEHDVIEDNWKEREFSFWVKKQIRFAERQAREELARRQQGGGSGMKGRLLGTPDQRILWLKGRWLHLPLYVRPVLYFVYRYFIRLGFLDGKEGFLYHFSQAFLYRLMVDVQIDELRAAEWRGR